MMRNQNLVGFKLPELSEAAEQDKGRLLGLARPPCLPSPPALPACLLYLPSLPALSACPLCPPSLPTLPAYCLYSPSLSALPFCPPRTGYPTESRAF